MQQLVVHLRTLISFVEVLVHSMQKIDASILIVDDDKDILTSLSLYLKHHFQLVETSPNPQNLTSLLNERSFECVILDMNFRKGVNDGKEGLYWLKYIKETRPETSVVLLTAYGNLEVAVEALKNWCFRLYDKAVEK